MSTKRWGGSHSWIDVSQPTGSPRSVSRYWMSAPTRMGMSPGVTTSKRSSGGVMASRLRASAKNGKTSSGVPGRTCSRRSSNVRIVPGTFPEPMGDLTSAPVAGPRADDHVRGDGPELVVMYADFTCPRCAKAALHLKDDPATRVVFRHFALKAKHPRSLALAHAAEAAALQDAFWPFHDALFADQGRIDDPHLWERCERLGLDVARFEADRRGEAVAQRVARDLREGLRAGVTSTPALVRPSVD